MTKLSLVGLYLSLLVFLFCLLPSSAKADAVSDMFTVYNPDGTVDLLLNFIIPEDPSVDNARYIADPSLADPSQSGNPTTLLEPDNTVSDIFGVMDFRPQGGSCCYLAWSSDTAEQPVSNGDYASFGGAGTISYPEGNGGPFDATMYLSPSLRSAGYTATFTSDAAVPEPGTLVLFGSGLISIVGLLRRKILG